MESEHMVSFLWASVRLSISTASVTEGLFLGHKKIRWPHLYQVYNGSEIGSYYILKVLTTQCIDLLCQN